MDVNKKVNNYVAKHNHNKSVRHRDKKNDYKRNEKHKKRICDDLRDSPEK